MSRAATERVLVYDRIDENRRKTTFLLIFFAVAVVLPFLLFALHFFGGALTILVVGPAFDFAEESIGTVLGISFGLAVTLAAIATVLAYRMSARLTLRIAGARPLPREEAPGLWRTVENLCIGAGLPPPRLHLIESDGANLASTGLDRDHASLVVTRGLLDLLEPRELEGAVAQELSQIGNEDVRTATVVGALVSLVWWPLLVVRLLRRLIRAIAGFAGSASPSLRVALGIGALLSIPFLLPPALLVVGFMLMPLALLVALPVGLRTGIEMATTYPDPTAGWVLLGSSLLTLYALYGPPIIGFLIRRRLGHRREFRADADALVLTRHPTGLARALARMTSGSRARVDVSVAVSPLFLVDPLPAGLRRLFLSTHPPVRDRIDALVSMAMIDPREIDEARRTAPAPRTPPIVTGGPPTETTLAPPDPAPEGSDPPAAVPRPVEPPAPPADDSSFCRLVRDSTTEYLSERLDRPLASRIRRHLATCPRCDEYVTWQMYRRLTSR